MVYLIYLINLSLYLTKAMKLKKKRKEKTTKLPNYNNSSIWKSNSCHIKTSQVIS